MSKPSPILVTGSHRSGTTWIGRMLALTSSLRYVHEPFRPDSLHDLAPLTTEHWYEYIPPNWTIGGHRTVLERALGLKYPLAQHLQDSVSFQEAYRHLRSAAGCTIDRWNETSVLLKDPLALLAAEWLDKQFDLEVLVMIRHPAAFAGSLKVKDWTFPFEDLLDQPQAMRDLFSEQREEIRYFAQTDQDIVDQAAFLWTLLYEVVLGYQERHSDWVFLRHEDVARSPLQTFQELYSHFGLDFTKQVRGQIKTHSSPSGAKSADEDLQRDSQSLIKNWKQRLTQDEIERVHDRTAPLASESYADDDW